jgi:hypothetical protein
MPERWERPVLMAAFGAMCRLAAERPSAGALFLPTLRNDRPPADVA